MCEAVWKMIIRSVFPKVGSLVVELGSISIPDVCIRNIGVGRGPAGFTHFYEALHILPHCKDVIKLTCGVIMNS